MYFILICFQIHLNKTIYIYSVFKKEWEPMKTISKKGTSLSSVRFWAGFAIGVIVGITVVSFWLLFSNAMYSLYLK